MAIVDTCGLGFRVYSGRSGNGWLVLILANATTICLRATPKNILPYKGNIGILIVCFLRALKHKQIVGDVKVSLLWESVHQSKTSSCTSAFRQ